METPGALFLFCPPRPIGHSHYRAVDGSGFYCLEHTGLTAYGTGCMDMAMFTAASGLAACGWMR